MHTLSITNDGLMGSNDSTHVRSFSRYEYYLLEQAMNGKESFRPTFVKQRRCRTKSADCPRKREIYPGLSLEHDLAAEYPRDARRQTGRNKRTTLYTWTEKPTQHCYFTKDYYWMGSNNTVNFSDSRLFGFVPQDHIIGKASIIWFSKEKETGLFDGYRWRRFFRTVK